MQAATKFESIKIELPKYCKSIEKFIIRLYLFFSSWRQVEEDDDSEFHYLEQEIHTNSSVASYTIEHPFSVVPVSLWVYLDLNLDQGLEDAKEGTIWIYGSRAIRKKERSGKKVH